MRLYLMLVFLFIVGYVTLNYTSTVNNIFGGGDKNSDCFFCKKITYNGYFTNWTISHFIAFLIAGIICPDYPILIISLGVLWELIELYLEYINKTDPNHFLCKMLNNMRCDTKIERSDFWDHYLGLNEQNYSFFWCSGGLIGGILDITADILGVYTGIYIAKKLIRS